MKKRRYTSLATIGLSVTLLLAACSSGTSTTGTGTSSAGTNSNPTTAPQTATSGGTLVVAAPVEPDTLDPQKTTWLDNTNSQPYDSILTRDLQGKLAPHLAESWQVSEDGKVWTLVMRKDVKFQSGAPMTAESVKASIERFATISPNKDLAGPIDKIEATDAQTVKVYFKEPFAPFANMLVGTFLSPFDPERLKEKGEQFGEAPLATGPFMNPEVKRGASVTYVKNPDYKWALPFADNQGAAHVDKLVFRFLKDDDTRILEFKKGTVNILQEVPSTYVEELKAIPGTKIETSMEQGMKYLGFNNQKEIFKDVRIKQAIAMAVDREPIVQYALSGFAKPIYGPLPPTIPGYSEKIENMAKEMYGHNVDKAKQLLAEAGYTDSNGDGIVDKGGKPLSFELLLSDDPALQRVAQILQSQLKEIGVDIKIAVTDIATVKDRATKGNHELFLLYFGLNDPDILYLLMQTKNSKRVHYSNPKVDELLAKGRTTMKEEDRMKVYEEAEELLVKDPPWVPLYSSESVTATRNIEGYKLNPFTSDIPFADISITK
ncbi:ABC transporter substrate-binding protein [Brevibacillus choshinensis]|uniref:ABC transporter substrate-binding protein n=1 Tax=Brevibacillus choshinensis TaxID=54911 RepID=UPI002E21D3A6|nr:ABC transporter substrate-binding protein [Brevibacillus choshinensis]MED4754577.1 ABC transporter substrate-binding protein [Brevibacillus choshinensis]MED4785212.1 ABC transporter substrate-binding protein [Brevibacillus choshinensis]